MMMIEILLLMDYALLTLQVIYMATAIHLHLLSICSWQTETCAHIEFYI